MSEADAFPQPESMPPSLQVFHNAVQHSFGDPLNAEALAAQREMLADVIRQGVAQQTDAPAQQAIQAYGDILEYAWFGPADGELPDEIVYATLHAEDHGELLIGSHVLSPAVFDEITGMLKMQMLPLLALRSRNQEKNKEGLLRVIQSYLAATPVGQALQQLGSNNDPLETRLDARQLAQRQALVDSMVAQSVKAQ